MSIRGLVEAAQRLKTRDADYWYATRHAAKDAGAIADYILATTTGIDQLVTTSNLIAAGWQPVTTADRTWQHPNCPLDIQQTDMDGHCFRFYGTTRDLVSMAHVNRVAEAFKPDDAIAPQCQAAPAPKKTPAPEQPSQAELAAKLFSTFMTRASSELRGWLDGRGVTTYAQLLSLDVAELARKRELSTCLRRALVRDIAHQAVPVQELVVVAAGSADATAGTLGAVMAAFLRKNSLLSAQLSLTPFVRAWFSAYGVDDLDTLVMLTPTELVTRTGCTMREVSAVIAALQELPPVSATRMKTLGEAPPMSFLALYRS